MKRFSSFFQLYLRVALGAGYLAMGLDRLGVWGKYGQPGVSWGDWTHFMHYAADVMQFLPYRVAAVLAVPATAGEIIFGALLLAGKWTRQAATGSGLLALVFAGSMAVSHGIMDPLGYSVFTVSAGSFLLATLPEYAWSLDALSSQKTKKIDPS